MFRKYPVNDSYFKTWSSTMAYILGFFSADSCVRKAKSKQRRFKIGLQCRDVAAIELMRDELSPTRHICFSKKNNISILDIESDEIADDLNLLGVITPKIERFFPDMPENFRGHYLRGLFDGDGCFCFYKSKKRPTCWKSEFTITHPSTTLLQIARHIFYDFGSVRRLLTSNAFRWQVGSREQCLALYHLMYGNGGFCLERKRAKFAPIVP